MDSKSLKPAGQHKGVQTIPTMADEPPGNRKGFQSFVFFDIYDEMEAQVSANAKKKMVQTSNDGHKPGNTAAGVAERAKKKMVQTSNGGDKPGNTAARESASTRKKMVQTSNDGHKPGNTAAAATGHKAGHGGRNRNPRAQEQNMAAKKKKQVKAKNKDGSEAYRAHIRTLARVTPTKRPLRLRVSGKNPEGEELLSGSGTGQRLTRSQTKRAAADSK